jgi:hypothetical protein
MHISAVLSTITYKYEYIKYQEELGNDHLRFHPKYIPNYATN